MWERIGRQVDQVNLIRRLPLVGVICCILTIALGASSLWNVYIRTQGDIREKLTDLSLVLAEQASHNIQVADILLHNVRARAQALNVSTSVQMRQAFGDVDGQHFITMLVETLPANDGIALFDANGALISRAHPSKSFSIADRDYFIWLRDHPSDEPVFAGPWISRANGQMSFYVARRIDGTDGRFLGVAVVGLSTQHYTDLYRLLVQNRQFAISLLRTDGTLLVRYPPIPSKSDLRPVRVRREADFFNRISRGGGTFRGEGFLIDHEVIMSVRPVPGYALVVDVAADASVVLNTWWGRSAFLLLVTPALGIAVLILFFSIARGVRSQERHAAALADHAQALRASEERLERAQEITALGSWEQEIETGRNIWSRNLFRIRGLDPSADISEAGLSRVLHQEETAVRRAWLNELAAGHHPGARDIDVVLPNGTACVLQMEGRAIVDPDGRIRRLSGTTRDVTRLRLLERGLIQSQKMEAIGNLAGGIAHDFNNILGVIIGNLDLLRTLVESGTEAAELCDEALDGATRGADLIKRLLAFARRQALQPEEVDVNALVADVGRLLRRALGDGIVLRMDLGKDVGRAMVDPVQLQASLVNLGTNARDAMPAGGRLHISTHGVTIGAQDREHHDGMSTGTYAVITVRDTGSGMDPDVLKHIFEPFFTTKAPEKGSGLGLSMVFGFVNQSGGHLSVRSEPGVGSSFRLYLPRVAEADAGPPPPKPMAARNGFADGVVLLVDDNAGFRRASARQLAALGYRAREAADAASAMRMLERSERVDILLTDLVLNGRQDGLDLAEAAVRLRPDLHVVLMSGWFGIRDAKARLSRAGYPLLGKPFFTDELAATLRGESLRQGVW